MYRCMQVYVILSNRCYRWEELRSQVLLARLFIIAATEQDTVVWPRYAGLAFPGCSRIRCWLARRQAIAAR